jgi:phage terminase large subunit-like protein
MRTLQEVLKAAGPEKAHLVAQMLSKLPPELKAKLKFMWPINARPAQLKPDMFPWANSQDPKDEDRKELMWFAWLILAGRGFGKTRAGAEYIRQEVEDAQRRKKPIRCALVGPTAGDARDIMVEGDSGILAICPPNNMPKYESSKRRLTWKDGSIATLFSAEEADRLRGPQHHVAWVDELAAWPDAQAVWDMLLFGMRLVRTRTIGPQICITTTPKPVPALVKIAKARTTFITSGSTYDNRANLAPTFFDAVVSNYEGTRLGRQEIAGELLLDIMGALWSAKDIDRNRVQLPDVPPLIRVVTAVDPSISEKDEAESGIVTAGLAANGHVYVLEDASIQGTPIEWARKAMSQFHLHKADKLIAEANNGGAMVENTLRTTAGLNNYGLYNYKAVYASRGKLTRAEPVSALYERNMVHHVGMMKELEDQMVSYSPAQAGKMLADRMDALVWAVTELAVKDVQSASRKGMFAEGMETSHGR